ncbi:hypothetical protein AAHB45_09090 [Pediococcus pentosaceus]|uniref:hypothetical protein n=1 Tax=Pediococcus pentosaceus TaxID=1255 RepID=UPI00316178F8
MKVKSKLALILAGSSLLLTACGNTKQASKSNNNEVAIYKQAKEPKEHVWLYARGTNDDSELDNIIFLKNGKIKTYSAGVLYKQRKIIQLKDVKNLSKTELKKKAIEWNDESNDPKYKKIRESDLIRKSGA